MTNADRCYLRATTRTIERLISTLAGVGVKWWGLMVFATAPYWMPWCL